MAAGVALAQLVPAGPFMRGPGLADKLLAWDAIWYRDIALHGYHWRPDGAIWGHNQNIAFFPLFPLLERGVNALAPAAAPVSFILLALICGIWSNFAFLGLARLLLEERAAVMAALLFALWPAICFLATGYPTGLFNLVVIYCLRHRLAKQDWRAVAWCGVGTALAPNGVFIALALGLDLMLAWWRAGAAAQALPRLGAQGVAAIAGLLGFALFQAVAFGDPLAFVKAQGGFNPASSFTAHLLRLCNPIWYILPADFAVQAFGRAIFGHLAQSAEGRQSVNIGWQWTLDLLTLGLSFFALLCPAGRRLPGVVRLAGWCALLGFLWFVGTSSINVTNAMRMLYPELPVFLVLGVMLPRMPGFGLAVVFGAIGAIELALVLAGYGVI